eukprot:SAG31_NODE_23381_length_505_cov_1.371921_1_plen_60_part_10
MQQFAANSESRFLQSKADVNLEATTGSPLERQRIEEDLTLSKDGAWLLEIFDRFRQQSLE